MSIKLYWFDFKIRLHVLKMRVVFCWLRNRELYIGQTPHHINACSFFFLNQAGCFFRKSDLGAHLEPLTICFETLCHHKI